MFSQSCWPFSRWLSQPHSFFTVTFDETGGNVSVKEFFAEVAQLVEQGAENARVTGAIPVLGTILGLETRGRLVEAAESRRGP